MTTHSFFIRCDGKYIRVNVADICYVEALKNYVRIVTIEKTYLALISLRQIEEELPEEHFCRIHRSYIVAMTHVLSFDNDMVYTEVTELPLSMAYRSSLQGKIRLLVSDTRSK